MTLKDDLKILQSVLEMKGRYRAVASALLEKEDYEDSKFFIGVLQYLSAGCDDLNEVVYLIQGASESWTETLDEQIANLAGERGSAGSSVNNEEDVGPVARALMEALRSPAPAPEVASPPASGRRRGRPPRNAATPAPDPQVVAPTAPERRSRRRVGEATSEPSVPEANTASRPRRRTLRRELVPEQARGPREGTAEEIQKAVIELFESGIEETSIVKERLENQYRFTNFVDGAKIAGMRTKWRNSKK